MKKEKKAHPDNLSNGRQSKDKGHGFTSEEIEFFECDILASLNSESSIEHDHPVGIEQYYFTRAEI